MKENDVEFIATQFGIDKEIVQASVEDGTLSARLKDSLDKRVVYDKDAFEAFKKNYAAEVSQSYFTDLVDKAKKGDLPQDLYKPVKGAAFQQLERELSKKYEVSEFSDVFDLIEKVTKKPPASGNDDLVKQIEDLKAANLKLKQESENALSTVETKYKTKIIAEKVNEYINAVPFDFGDVKPEEIEGRRAKTHTILKSVFDSSYAVDMDDKGNYVVKDKEGNVIKNNATLDPVPVQDVFMTLAKDYNLKLKSPDSGGQGGKSSGVSTGTFTDYDSFIAYCGTKGIDPMSKEAIEMWRKSPAFNTYK